MHLEIQPLRGSKKEKIIRYQRGYHSGHCDVSFNGAKGFRTEGLLVLVSVADCVKCVLPYGNGAGFQGFPEGNYQGSRTTKPTFHHLNDKGMSLVVVYIV